MMSIPYFPGCTLTNKAKGLGDTAKECLKILGVELKELDNWYCCQANFSTLTDNLMNHLAPVRTLVAARKQGERLVVLCSTCYYVLKRVSILIEKDEEKRKTVFDFLEEEYQGPIKIIHFLELIRDVVGFSKLNQSIKISLKNLAVAPYYGCQLLRPFKELAFDDPFAPTIFEQFLQSLDCQVIDYPFKTECCGSFLVTSDDKAVEGCVLKILNYARKNGAEIITSSCPLCNFNLDWSQRALATKSKRFRKTPILYLTELMALAMGVKISSDIWNEHIVDPVSFLTKKGYLVQS